LERHLRALKVLLISNSHWGIKVVESPSADTTEIVSCQRLVDSGGLVVTDPDLPLFCYLKAKVQGILFNFLCIVIGKFFRIIWVKLDGNYNYRADFSFELRIIKVFEITR
jgi:hypothetical protein